MRVFANGLSAGDLAGKLTIELGRIQDRTKGMFFIEKEPAVVRIIKARSGKKPFSCAVFKFIGDKIVSKIKDKSKLMPLISSTVLVARYERR